MVTCHYGVFTLADTDTDKKWVIKNCVKVFILPDTDTDTNTDAIGLQTHFVGFGVGVGHCEHTINILCVLSSDHLFHAAKTKLG